MDDDDKVRRNCMAASAAVLTGWALDIQQKDVWKRFLGEELTVQPFRAWLLISLVLLYLFMRYLFSDERGKAHGEMLHEFNTARAMAIVSGLKRDYLRYKRTGSPARHFKDDGARLMKEAEEGASSFSAFLPTYGTPGALRFTAGLRAGFIPIPMGQDAVGQLQPVEIEFEVERRLRIRSAAYATLTMLTWSKGLTEILIPIPLALAAITYSLCKVVGAW